MLAVEFNDLAMEALWLVLVLSLPILGAAFLASVLLGLFQTFTKMSEPAITQVSRIVAVLAVLVVALPWVGQAALLFATETWTMIQHVSVP